MAQIVTLTFTPTNTPDVFMSDADIVHNGGCFCNGVRYKVVGLPLLSAYCHCTLCQRLNGDGA
jgi:hypothetical protein